MVSPQACAPPRASLTSQRNPLRIVQSLCRKLESALATIAVRRWKRGDAVGKGVAVAISDSPFVEVQSGFFDLAVSLSDHANDQLGQTAGSLRGSKVSGIM
jgi:hypothetical protein